MIEFVPNLSEYLCDAIDQLPQRSYILLNVIDYIYIGRVKTFVSFHNVIFWYLKDLPIRTGISEALLGIALLYQWKFLIDLHLGNTSTHSVIARPFPTSMLGYTQHI